MADFGLTEVTAVIQQNIGTVIQTYLQETSRLIPLTWNYSVEKGIDRIKIPRAGGFTVNSKAENTVVTAQTITYATDSLILDQYKVIQVLMEEIADLQARPDIVQDIIVRMGKDMAYDIDKYLVTKLIAASASAPDHRLAYANSAGANTLGKADLLAARELLHVQHINFNECYIGVSPGSEVDLLAIDDFVHVDKYGSSDGLVNGELGKLYGAKVVMSNAFSDAATVVWHPTAVAFGMQKMPTFRTQDKLEYLATLLSVDQLYGAVTLDGGKRQVLLGSAT